MNQKNRKLKTLTVLEVVQNIKPFNLWTHFDPIACIERNSDRKIKKIYFEPDQRNWTQNWWIVNDNLRDLRLSVYQEPAWEGLLTLVPMIEDLRGKKNLELNGRGWRMEWEWVWHASRFVSFLNCLTLFATKCLIQCSKLFLFFFLFPTTTASLEQVFLRKIM